MTPGNSYTIQNEIRALSNWTVVGSALVRTIDTPHFMASLDLANKIGARAEKMNHHPDLTVSWGKLTIQLTSHEEKAITEKDIVLAKEIDTLLGQDGISFGAKE